MICPGHTYRSDKYQLGDDSMRVKMTIQMADAAASIQNSVHSLTIGAKFGLPIIFRGLQLTCVRSLSEVPDVVLETVWNSTVNTTTGFVLSLTQRFMYCQRLLSLSYRCKFLLKNSEVS